MSVRCKVSVPVLLLSLMCSGWTACGQEKGSRQYVVFWNLENYFDPFNDSLTLDDEFTPAGEKHWTWKKFLVKRNLIAKVLLSMRDRYGDWPLAVGFAEVENRMVLRQLTEQTPLAKLGYGVVHRDSPDSRGIDVGFIYREEYMTVLEVEARAVLTGRERPTRDILHVAAGLHLPGGQPDTMHFIINHWPSKFGGEEYSRPFGSLRYSPEGRGSSQGLRLRGAAACDCHRGFQRYSGLSSGGVAATGDGPAQSGIVPA